MCKTLLYREIADFDNRLIEWTTDRLKVWINECKAVKKA